MHLPRRHPVLIGELAEDAGRYEMTKQKASRYLLTGEDIIVYRLPLR